MSIEIEGTRAPDGLVKKMIKKSSKSGISKFENIIEDIEILIYEFNDSYTKDPSYYLDKEIANLLRNLVDRNK